MLVDLFFKASYFRSNIFFLSFILVMSEDLKRKQQQQNRVSSASTTKSIKFQDVNDADKESTASGP